MDTPGIVFQDWILNFVVILLLHVVALRVINFFLDIEITVCPKCGFKSYGADCQKCGVSKRSKVIKFIFGG